MTPIDKPFRLTWDFCLVWALLAAAMFLLTHQSDFSPWYSYAAILILLPLFATFVLYGPVLLARQIVRSGSRGWFVARMFLSILLAAVLLFGGLYYFGFYTESRARIVAFFFIGTATGLLSWRAERR